MMESVNKTITGLFDSFLVVKSEFAKFCSRSNL